MRRDAKTFDFRDISPAIVRARSGALPLSGGDD
jgi:hypothetical protein